MTVKFPFLEPWQKDLLNAYIANPKDKWFVVKSLRQCGKSTIAQILLIYASLKKDNSISISVSPILQQAKKMFEDICKIGRDIIVKKNASIYEIEFINGSKILFKSGEQSDSIRGNTVKGSGILVIDEAAYLKDELFYSVLVPTTNVNRSDIFIFSTPKTKQGFFYHLYSKGMEGDEKIMSINWNGYDTSKYLPKELLELYRLQMPKLSFQTEYLGDFIDGDGTVFSSFRNCIKHTNIDISKEMWIGLDWASGVGKDYTVLTLAQEGDNKINVIRQIEFNDKGVNATIDIILQTVKEMVSEGLKTINIVAEKNSLGQVYFDLLNDTMDEYQIHNSGIEINCSTFITTNKSKEKIIKQLNILIENGKINIPNEQRLINQLSAYECKININGVATYNAPQGQNDDRVMSLLICINNLFGEIDIER